MNNNLMAKEEWDKLGFDERRQYQRRQNDEGTKESAGFVAGLNVRGSKKGVW